MQTLIVLYIGSLLFFTACSPPTRSASKVNSFFPLKVGNKWYYSTSYPDTTAIDLIWTVSALTTIDKKPYYEVIENHLQSNHRDTVFYRMNGDTLFWKNPSNTERVLADFSLGLNDSAYWKNDGKVVTRTETTIEFSTPFGADYGESRTYRMGTGLTLLITNGFIYYQQKLVKADIK